MSVCSMRWHANNTLILIAICLTEDKLRFSRIYHVAVGSVAKVYQR